LKTFSTLREKISRENLCISPDCIFALKIADHTHVARNDRNIIRSSGFPRRSAVANNATVAGDAVLLALCLKYFIESERERERASVVPTSQEHILKQNRAQIDSDDSCGFRGDPERGKRLLLT